MPIRWKKSRLAVGIATAGRASILTESLRELSCQTRAPDVVFLCPAADPDIDRSVLDDLPYEVRIVQGARGLPSQRNAILAAAGDFDVIAFFDDDFFAHPSYLAEVEVCFATWPDVTAASGLVIADDVKGPGLDAGEARRILGAFDALSIQNDLSTQYNAYGCNMCVRLAPVYAHGLLFDENLPLYGWLEDVDFCRRLARFGRIVKNNRMIGVHLGVKSGRTSGVRFGYSQVANPLYIWRKGSTHFIWALHHIGKNILANMVRAWFPEPWVDRRGRIRGNVAALRDLVRGRLDPRRILDFN